MSSSRGKRNVQIDFTKIFKKYIYSNKKFNIYNHKLVIHNAVIRKLKKKMISVYLPYILPLGEYLWVLVVLYLTNLSYVNYLNENPIINLGWNAVKIPIWVYYALLGIGGTSHLVSIGICYKLHLKSIVELLV
jgi:hypothetical protein